MKSDRPYPFVTIDARGAKRAQQGHPWVFDNEITAQEGALEDGALCDVRSPKGRYLGTGYYNSHSKIRVRLLSQNANDKFDQAFFARRAQYAWDYRKTVMGRDADSCRVIFGEADRFPGLTVDKFGDILVTQTLCLGTELRKDWIFPALVQAIEAGGEHIRGIYERNDVKIRELEGMEQNKGWYPLEGKPLPESTQTEIVENGIRYLVDFENGQKTGFFLDQKYNRRQVAKLARGKRVLDCFTHTGSFALNAAYGGAAHVTAVDVSQTAVDMARANAERNGLEDRMDFVCTDVFELLPTLEGTHNYDFIILDPPAFTKARKTAANAMRGYKEINYRAMKLLPRGGYLATASCSHFATEEMFIKMLKSAAADAGRQLRQIEVRQQSPDHPILWNVEETNYLKFFLFQVI